MDCKTQETSSQNSKGSKLRPARMHTTPKCWGSKDLNFMANDALALSFLSYPSKESRAPEEPFVMLSEITMEAVLQ